jgi:hypothetical protein
MENEIQEIVKLFQIPPIQAITWDDMERSLSIKFVVEDKKGLRLSFYIPEDFPSMRPLCSIERDETTKKEKVKV